ncbi:MAG: tRNA 2-thiouridine(34) synthase MnmA [Proteobacteria bacterium]|nr:tRNA 2-thiouridine(34) synthase MnmA [Pseudomonadota bacterium]
METVFIAMSGGIDSSFTAYLLKQKGYKVVGITFQLLPEAIKSTKNPKACCSIETIHRAKKMANDLSIPHYIINMRKEFEEHVINNFLNEYKHGRTPNPCILCNKYIKFQSFLDKALSIGADKIATGHYAIIDQTSGGYTIRKGTDKAKDQSYFLYPIKEGLLKHILFPLGTYTKDNLRVNAGKLGWNLQNVKESQDICFIPEGNYRDFLSNYMELKEGPVYHAEGTFMGMHNGIHLYTIGQRRGLNIPYKEPLYVIEIIPDKNTLIVGPKEYLKRKKLVAHSTNFFNMNAPPGLAPGSLSAKVRYRQKEEACTFTISDDLLYIDFKNPLYSIAPGQSVVIYKDDAIVCGGIIRSSE